MSGGKSIGCIGKCTTGLTLEELDLITDHIHRTLTHNQGRKVFRRYLEQSDRTTELACLDLYEQLIDYIDKERDFRVSESSPNTEQLETYVNLALTAAEELDDVPEIDLALLQRYTHALETHSRDSLLSVLEDTKASLMNHLRQAHKGFRAYAMLPCPKNK